MTLEVTTPDTEPGGYSSEDIFEPSSAAQPAGTESFGELSFYWMRNLKTSVLPLPDLSSIIRSDASSKYPSLEVIRKTFFTKQLSAQVRKLRALKGILGMLNELTPEQLKIFETAVERRAFFK
jgi:hypothetical protein